MQKALYGAVTAEDLRAVARKLGEVAKDGNWQAAKLLVLWVVGAPSPAPKIGRDVRSSRLVARRPEIPCVEGISVSPPPSWS